jgi:tetratricopeptide (TPR) repeat protein
MKFYLKFTLLLLIPFCGFTQSFKQAKELARKNDQAILLIMEVPLPPNLVGPAPNKGYKDEEVVKKMRANFVVVEANRSDTAISSFATKFTRYPAFVFMHANGEVFHNDHSYGVKEKYLAMINKALLLRKEKTVAQLQSEYTKHPDNFTLLKELIIARKRTGLRDNAALIEKYVTNLKVGDFNDYQTVLFILEAGPFADGNAYKFARTNQRVIDSIYKYEPSQLRVEFNQAIINNTMDCAIRTNNKMRAQSAANFTRTTWGKDYVRGDKGYNGQMIRFYKATKDTVNYFRTAIHNYDTYYMNISADSVKKLDAKERAALMARTKMPEGRKLVSMETMDSLRRASPPNAIRRTEIVAPAVTALTYASELNNIAYQFYQTGTKNLNHLTKAMIWSKRAVELSPQAGFYDTLAHIYYAMGIHVEALATQKIAVDLVKNSKDSASIAQMTAAYEKMKARTL